LRAKVLSGVTIDHLLLYAKHSQARGSHPTSFAPTEVQDLIEGALETLRPSLDGLGFKLTVDLPDRLPRVKADRAAMVAVMENFVDNSIKYSGDTRELNISASSNGDRISIVFTDRGRGIPPDDVPHVFERFYRGSNTHVSGSGLGLAIAQRVVESHGGTISLRSTVEVGTEVHVTLLAADNP
jgi:signal transduction histidine kinase